MREQISSSEEKESQGCGTHRQSTLNVRPFFFLQIAFLDYNLRICCSGKTLSNTISVRIDLFLLQILQFVPQGQFCANC